MLPLCRCTPPSLPRPLSFAPPCPACLRFLLLINHYVVKQFALYSSFKRERCAVAPCRNANWQCESKRPATVNFFDSLPSKDYDNDSVATVLYRCIIIMYLE